MSQAPPKRMLAAALGIGIERRARIGLLGGSFNPAHEGHLHISREALKALALDEVWWLVSPQNPLKERSGMAPLKERLASARAIAKGRPFRVNAVETLLGTHYTVDTLAALRRQLPRLSFVWLMGADNLLQIAQWKGWQEIFGRTPIAVFDRPTYSARAAFAKAAQRFADARVAPRSLRQRAIQPPAWCLIRCKLNQASATSIRNHGPRGQAKKPPTKR